MQNKWVWFLFGALFVMFVLPLFMGMLGRSKVSTTKSRGA